MSDHVLNIEADSEDRKEALRGGGRSNTFAKEIKVFAPNPLLTQKGRMEFELGEIPGTAMNIMFLRTIFCMFCTEIQPF